MLEWLNPTANKGEDHMISSDSFVFDSGTQLACHQVLYSTSFLGLRGRQQLCLEVGIQNSQHGTKTSYIRILYPLDHKPSTCLGSQDRVLIHNPRQRGVWQNLEREQE